MSELIELSAVIGEIYDAAIDPSLWQKTLGSICAYVGGYSAALFWHDVALRNAQALYLFNDDPSFTKLYFEKYLPMDPFFPASNFVETGVVHGSRDIVPQAELEQTRFYKEWIAPQGIADAVFSPDRIDTAFVDRVDRRPGREARHHELGGKGDRERDVQGSGEKFTGLGQQRQ